MDHLRIISLSSGDLSASISVRGAELQSITDRAGNQLQWDGDPAVWSGRAPILFPFIGLLNGGEYRLDGKTYAMPKHGFARHATFAVVDHHAAGATFRLTASDATRAIYPFDFQLDIIFSLVGPSLTLAAAITNHGAEAMPASFGFHPAFRWPLPFGASRADHRLVFGCTEPAPIRRIDQTGLLIAGPEPTPVVGDTLPLHDELFVNDALIFDRLTSRAVTYGASDGPQLHIAFADFPTLGVWTKPGADFLCIEPWHGYSDPVGFTGDVRDKPGVFEVAPGATRTMAMHIAVIT